MELATLLETAVYQKARIVLVILDDMPRQNRSASALIVAKVAADDRGSVLYLLHGVAKAAIIMQPKPVRARERV